MQVEGLVENGMAAHFAAANRHWRASILNRPQRDTKGDAP
jgi:hypothetical protein